MARYSWLAGLGLLCSLVCSAQTFTGRVVGVADGDTVTVLIESNRTQKIRLAGIDAPEKKQAFGSRAKQALSDKIFNRTVTVVSNSTDRYHRWVCDIHLEDRWINREMVAEGWAWWYRQYSTSEILAQAEIDAQTQKKGLWADPQPQPPWNFRRQAKTQRAQIRPTTVLDTKDDL
jgi:endonuclease YncB( thermonuclease family)